jgi:hypothetical protein
MKNSLESKLLLFIMFTFGIVSYAQINICRTADLNQKTKKSDPTFLKKIQDAELKTQEWIKTASQSKRTQKKTNQVVTIPVVVHVLWHEEIENISDTQIQSQIDVLNKDFRLLNSDKLSSSHPFFGTIADAQIQFVLAKQDPMGIATNGITRTYTDTVVFDIDVVDYLQKFTASGGINNWEPTKYLNIWVCNLKGNNLGFTTFPVDLATYPEKDGITMNYRTFGTTGVAGLGDFTPYNLGRITTHEVGHWLNLLHIWGDDYCGDDLVADTVPAYTYNVSCPDFPSNPNNSCTPGSDANGEMYMNYMDYVNDDCKNMFTLGQVTRMQAALNMERSGILTSLGGIGGTLATTTFESENALQLYPNPSTGVFSFTNDSSEKLKIIVLDSTGKKLKTLENIEKGNSKIDLSNLKNGVYYFKTQISGVWTTKKVIIAK